MNRRANPLLPWLSVAVGLALVLAGCTKAPPLEMPGPTGVVGDRGVTVKLGGITANAPAGVAPSGTGITIAATDVRPEGLQGISVASAFDISFENQVQPQKPVSVSFQLPSDRSDYSTLVFLTHDSTSGTWEVLPVAIHGDEATVTMQHFSTGLFAWGDKVRDWFIEQVKQFLGLSYPAPNCTTRLPGSNGLEYSITRDGDGFHLCVENPHTPAATLHSNSPFVWRILPLTSGTVGLAPDVPLELSALLTVAFFHSITPGSDAKQTIVAPGGGATLKLGATPMKAAAKVDPGLGLIAVLVAGIDFAAAMATGQGSGWLKAVLEGHDRLSDFRDAAECLSGIAESINNPSENLGAIASSTLKCTGSLLTRLVTGVLATVVGITIGIITSLIGTLITQVWGLIRELTGQNEVQISVSSTPQATIQLLEGGGMAIDGVDIGRGGPSEIALLTRALGQPDSTSDFTCDVSFTKRRWGNLTVLSLKNRYSPDSGGEWQAGGVSGWRYEDSGPSRGKQLNFIGPQGIALGTPAREVVSRYEAHGDLFNVDWSGNQIGALAGDTVGVAFELNEQKRVRAIWAGLRC